MYTTAMSCAKTKRQQKRLLADFFAGFRFYRANAREREKRSFSSKHSECAGKGGFLTSTANIPEK
ncbi:hypothetical protein [Marvinbryantia formatexigens]|nr:hypothetical protein [Marvinbryantia formatexigens]